MNVNKQLIDFNKLYFGEAFLNKQLENYCYEEVQNNIDQITILNPYIMLFISLTIGFLGVDQLLVKKPLKAVLKFFTFGGFLFIYAYDVFTIFKQVRLYNQNQYLTIVGDNHGEA